MKAMCINIRVLTRISYIYQGFIGFLQKIFIQCVCRGKLRDCRFSFVFPEKLIDSSHFIERLHCRKHGILKFPASQKPYFAAAFFCFFYLEGSLRLYKRIPEARSVRKTGRFAGEKQIPHSLAGFLDRVYWYRLLYYFLFISHL